MQRAYGNVSPWRLPEHDLKGGSTNAGGVGSYPSMGVGVLAEQARLERSAARRTLTALLDTGLVEIQGEGKAPQYILRREHPLAPPITALFEAERLRADTLFEGIEQAVRQLTPPPMAVWIEGRVGFGHRRAGRCHRGGVIRTRCGAGSRHSVAAVRRSDRASISSSFDRSVSVVCAPAKGDANTRAAIAPLEMTERRPGRSRPDRVHGERIICPCAKVARPSVLSPRHWAGRSWRVRAPTGLPAGHVGPRRRALPSLSIAPHPAR